MNRREFLGAMAVAPIAIRGGERNAAARTFEIITKIELEESHDAGVARVPLPLAPTAPYQIDRGHAGSKGKPLPFLMYPQAEVGGERRDSLDPEHFKYTITAREM